jgi:hypothetical protein
VAVPVAAGVTLTATAVVMLGGGPGEVGGLRDPGRDANEQPQVIRWPVYEVLTGSDTDRLLTLTGAHPSPTWSATPSRS